MNCINHNTVSATANCTKCGVPICAGCACNLDGAVVCPTCLLTASRTRMTEALNTKRNYLIYIILAAIVYIAGLVCFLIGLNDRTLLIIGLLIMGIPNITFAFKMQFLLIAGVWTRILAVVACIAAGIITTPIFIIKSAIGYAKANKNKNYWLQIICDCRDNYPFLFAQQPIQENA